MSRCINYDITRCVKGSIMRGITTVSLKIISKVQQDDDSFGQLTSLKTEDVWISVYLPKGVSDIVSAVPEVTTFVGALGGWISFDKNSNKSDWVTSMGGKWGEYSGATRNFSTNESHENAAEMHPAVWPYLDAHLSQLKKRRVK